MFWRRHLKWSNDKSLCGWIVGFVIGVSAIAGCEASNEGVTTLTFWAMGSEGENVQKLIPRFESEHPGITVRVQQIPWTAAHEKLLTAFAGNSLPDLFQLGNTWIPEFSFLNAIAPLDPFLGESTTIQPQSYFDGVWETNVIDSTVYGIPWYVDTRLLFYRKDILAAVGFQRPPTTWNELKEVSRRITKTSASRKRYAIFLPTNEWQPAVVFGLEVGSPLLKENNTRGDFSGESFARAFRFLRSFYEEDLSPTSWMDVQNVYQAFAEGYIAMYITGPWQIGEFRRRLPSNVRDKWMTAPLPASEPGRLGYSVAGGSSLVISRTSPRQTEAWKLIQFLSRPDVQMEFFRLMGNLPARLEAWDDPLLKEDPYLQAFFRQLEYVTATPKIPEWEQIAFAKVIEHVERAANVQIADEEILHMLDRDVDRILEKRRWMMQRMLTEREQ